MTDPYVGQTVHFVDAGAYRGQHLAAIVTKVWPDTGGMVNLNVHNPGTSYPVNEPVMAIPSTGYNADFRLGTWHFIEGQLSNSQVISGEGISGVTQSIIVGAGDVSGTLIGVQL